MNKNSFERLKQLHDCLLTLGTDSHKNIETIIMSIGELFNAASVIYSKTDGEIISSWGTTKNLKKISENIFKTVDFKTFNKVIYLKNLENKKNPKSAITLKEIKTYLGKVIKIEKRSVGILIIMFSKDFELLDDDLKLFNIFCSSLSIEETRLKSQNALAESEQRFKSLFENSTIGIYRSTPKGKIIFANLKFINLLGYSSFEELQKIDLNKDLYLNRKSRIKFKKNLEDEKRINGYLENLKRKDGSIIHVRESARVIYDDLNSKILYYEGTIEDITTQKRYETALIQSEEKFRSIFENGGSGIIITNNKNKFIEVNPKFCDLLGYSKEELLKMTYLDITYPEDMGKSKKLMSQLHAGIKKTIQLEKRYIKKDGTIIWGSISVGLILDDDTNQFNNVGIFEEITDRITYLHELKARDKVLSALSFSTETFLKTLDWQANINEVLKRLGESLEVSRSYIFQNHIGKNGDILASQRYEWVDNGISAEIDNQIMQNMSYKKIGLSELLEAMQKNIVFSKLTNNFNKMAIKLFKDQNINSILIVPIYSFDTLWGFMGFDDCKSERVWTEQETEALKTAGNLFGVAIRRKIFEEELLKAKIKAEESDKLKSQFLAQMSHEIRSPINSILSFTNLLKDDIRDNVDHDLQSSFEIIESAGKRISRTIDLILNMSEIQTGTYEYLPRKVDVYKDVLSTLSREFKGIAETRGLQFKLIKKTDDTIRKLDEYTVMQIFVNLLDNAFKYTIAGKIQIIIKKNRAKKLEIIIEDTGIGMSAKYLPKLFSPFSQEEQGYSRKFEGNGLGLALVKNYCDMNEANISVKSKKNVGTTFTITFN